MRFDPTDDPHGDELERLEREDRVRDKASRPFANVVPLRIGGGFRAGYDERLERELVAASARAPRLVVAGDVVAELERQHRRAYRRRQEGRARAARRRAALRYAGDLALGLAGAALALLALTLILGGR